MSTIQIENSLYQQLTHIANHRKQNINDLAQVAISAYISNLLPQVIYESKTEHAQRARRNLLELADAAHQEYLANGGQPLDEVGISRELADRRVYL